MKTTITILIILLVTSAVFGQNKQKKIQLKTNPELLRQEILSLIPIGQKIKEAQRIMEANKFSCSTETNKHFIAGNEDKQTQEYKNLNFLSCERKRHTLNPKRLIYLRLWQAAFVQKEGVITDILVYVGWFSDL